ncbi:MAG: hypothetical protein U7123_24530 [Potamolinea sp.]
MTKASSWWQQILKIIESLWLVLVKGRAFRQFHPQRFRGPGGWLIVLTGVVAMLFWNWKLLLATGAGIFVMLLVYLMQEWDWQLYWSSLRRFFNGSNRQLTIAVASGGIATFSTYMAIAICLESDSSWIATGAILQGFGTLATFILLVWLLISPQESRDEINRDDLLNDLSDPNPVKRLLAVRQLTRSLGSQHLHPSARNVVVECFCLMLSREEESVIRNAVLDGIQALSNNQVLDKGTQPLQLPITLKQSVVKVPHQ